MELQRSATVFREKALVNCFHCDEQFKPADFRLVPESEGHLFCCEGCKTVYEILSSNNLCQYYDIENKPGFSLKGRQKEAYHWLDDSDICTTLIDFTDGKNSKVTFYLPQIHCAACIWLLENLYKLSPGIMSSKVNFLKKEVYITFSNSETSLRKVVEILASIGYAPELNLGSIGNKKKPLSKRLIYQLGVAGFAFGNIMLFSFPEYVGLTASETYFRNVFGYFNLALAIPVAFYSGRDYLNGAWHSIRTWTPGIDIPLALGIIVLFFRSAYEILSLTGAGYMDSLAGLVFFLLIGKWFQQMTYHQISFERDYKSYFPIAATKVLPGGETVSHGVNKLEPGDLIRVRHKELIPADGVLKKGKARIDYSFVTGESEPIELISGDKVYAGGRQMSDAIDILLTRKVSQSYLTQLWNESAFENEKMAGTSRLANYISRYFTVIILAVSLITLIYWLPIDTEIAFRAFTAVLIIACPCAAALNVPFTLGNAVKILSRKGLFLKNTNVIEALYKISAVVFDKTGTLTEAGGNKLEYQGTPLSLPEKQAINSISRHSSHPLSLMLEKQFDGGMPTLEVSDFREFEGKGISGRVGGSHFRIGSLAFLKEGKRENFEIDLTASVYLEIDKEVKGGFILRNRYRHDAWKVVSSFQKEKETYMLSGDNDQESIYLASRFAQSQNNAKGVLHFNQSPKDKLNFVRNLQEKEKRVLMIGDGLNDAGALKQSDVGVVIAENANNFTPSCDAILDASKFGLLPSFIDYARKSIHLVYAAWGLAVIYNIIGLSFAVKGLLSPIVAAILMPASSITIVVFGVGASTLLARKLLKH